MFFLALLPDIISNLSYKFIIVKFMLSTKHSSTHKKSFKYEKRTFKMDVKKQKISDLVFQKL